MALPLLALDKLVQFSHRGNALVQLDLDAQLVLQIHQQLHSVQRINAQFGKGTLGLHSGNITTGTVGNNLCNRVKIHNELPP